MFTIKLSLNNENRRITIPMLNGKPSISFQDLCQLTTQTYQSDLIGPNIAFHWFDEEGDYITLSSDMELQHAFESMKSQNKTTFKFDVSSKTSKSAPASDAKVQPNGNSIKTNTKSASVKAVHNGVTCDECGMSPIMGPRFKCAVRQDFDLCETCESKNVQPFPTVKIYHPDQSPLAILIAIKDDEKEPRAQAHFQPHHGRSGGFHQFGGGPKNCHGRRGPHGHPHHHHPHHRGPFSFGLWGSSSGCGSNANPSDKESWLKSTGDKCNSTADNSQKLPEVFNDAEQSMIAEALRLSLSDSEEKLSQNHAAEKDNVLTDASPRADKKENEVVESNLIQTSNSSVTSTVPSKPALRFIGDVTMPDGTKVVRNSSLVKIWRVRNDGATSWPDGSYITTAGGDLLTAPNLKVPVSLANPGEEVEISVPIQVPEQVGRFVAYFRLQTKEGASFGQRLWVDLRVVNEEPVSDWQVVNKKSDAEIVAEFTPGEVSKEIIASNNIKTDSIAVDANLASSLDVTKVANDVWSKIWNTELAVLATMGFHDLDLLIPLLQEHVKNPASNKVDAKQPDPEGMQRVVLQLLSMAH